MLEATVTTGHVSKLAIAFTHMDALAGDDVGEASRKPAKKRYLGYVRRWTSTSPRNYLAKQRVSLSNHLAKGNIFYFTSLNVAGDKQSNPELGAS